MPIYEYQCQSCGTRKEVLQKISDPLLTDCDACGKSELKKLLSAAGFRLSGGGWYETDFKTGNKKNLAGEGGSKDASASAAASTTPPAKSTGDSSATAS